MVAVEIMRNTGTIADCIADAEKTGDIRDHVAQGKEQYGMQTDMEYFEERMRIEDVTMAIDEVNWTREGQESKQYRIERLEHYFRLVVFLVGK